MGTQPTGLTVTLSPNRVTVPSSGTAFSTLIVSISGSASPGTFHLLITGTSLISRSTSYVPDVAVTIATSAPPTCCTGSFVNPAVGVNIGSTQGLSPSHKYQVETSAGSLGLANITVRRVSDAHIVLANTQAAFWGFSPDDDRFVTHSVQDPGGASIDHVALYDLTRATPLIWSSGDSTHSSRIQFSPSGRYLFYSDVVGGPQTHLTLIDARTGTKEFNDDSISQLAGAPVAGQDLFGTIGWGFGPDDSRFVYGYVSAQTPQTNVQWNLVSLKKGPGHALVKNISLIGETGAYWQFSPCGDVIALVHQPGQQSVRVEIYITKDGTSAGPGAQIASPVQSIQLHATSTTQVATANGSTDYVLGANTSACTTPSSPPPPPTCCTGPYVNAVQPVEIAVSEVNISPGGKYQVDSSAGASGLANITVRRVADSHIVLTNIQAAFWGFSPDDDRFVTHWVQDPGGASIDHVELYDLTNGSRLWSSPDSTHSSRIQFSPAGRYLFYTDVVAGPQTHLTLIDARTGVVEFTDSISQLAGAPIAGQDSFGTIGWGFGPDDSRFVYAYVIAQTPQMQIQWNLVNLEKGPGHALVNNILLIGETAAYWQFSPCGDVIALAHQPGQNGVQVEIYNTKDGSPAGSSTADSKSRPIHPAARDLDLAGRDGERKHRLRSRCKHRNLQRVYLRPFTGEHSPDRCTGAQSWIRRGYRCRRRRDRRRELHRHRERTSDHNHSLRSGNLCDRRLRVGYAHGARALQADGRNRGHQRRQDRRP